MSKLKKPIASQKLDLVLPTAEIRITEELEQQIRYFVSKAPKECQWYSVVKRSIETDPATKKPIFVYTLSEFLIPEQEVTGGSVDTDPGKMAALMLEIAETMFGGDKIASNAVISNMTAWCHSHVNMEINPSPVDHDNFRDLIKGAKDAGSEDKPWLMLIFNKRDEYFSKIYEPTLYGGVYFETVPIVVQESVKNFAFIDEAMKSKVKETTFQGRGSSLPKGSSTIGAGDIELQSWAIQRLFQGGKAKGLKARLREVYLALRGINQLPVVETPADRKKFGDLFATFRQETEACFLGSVADPTTLKNVWPLHLAVLLNENSDEMQTLGKTSFSELKPPTLEGAWEQIREYMRKHKIFVSQWFGYMQTSYELLHVQNVDERHKLIQRACTEASLAGFYHGHFGPDLEELSPPGLPPEPADDDSDTPPLLITEATA